MACGSPGIEAAGERAHAVHTTTLQEERHTSARSFAGSSAIENDFSVPRNLLVPILQLFESNDLSAWDAMPRGFEREAISQVEDLRRIVRIHQFAK